MKPLLIASGLFWWVVWMIGIVCSALAVPPGQKDFGRMVRAAYWPIILATEVAPILVKGESK